MYQLFCPYGNLLSVRIMVEKDTGRSRGFGFVSYDSPDAAALAIKELNGFAVSYQFFGASIVIIECSNNVFLVFGNVCIAPGKASHHLPSRLLFSDWEQKIEGSA